MNVKKLISVATLGVALAAPLAQAQEERARSVQELLRMVEQGRASDSAENRAREQRFRDNKAEQQTILNQARAAKTAAENRSAELEELYARGLLVMTVAVLFLPSVLTPIR